MKPDDTYVVNRDGSGLRKFSDEETKNLPPAFGSRTRDHKRMAYAENGDIFIYDFSTGTKRQMTKTTDIETNPEFTQDEKSVTFMRGGNLYAMSVNVGDAGMLEQLTDIRPAAVPGAAAAPVAGAGGRGGGRGGRGGGPAAASAPPAKGTDSQEFLKKQEIDLILAVKERKAAREEAEAKRKKDAPPARKPFQLQARESANRLDCVRTKNASSRW